MPINIDPNSDKRNKTRISQSELKQLSSRFNYDYPNGLDLRPGYELHETLKEEVLHRARESARFMSQRHKDWRDIDKNLKFYSFDKGHTRSEVYMSSSPSEGAGKGDKDEKVDRIVMPVSYAMLETILTFFTSAFLQNPVFEYHGTGPEDVVGAKLLTEVVQNHVHRNTLGLQLHTAWRDMFAYGTGAVGTQWSQEYGKKTVLRQVGILDRIAGLFKPTGQKRVESEYQLLEEGNDLINIDPYRYLPDPGVAGHEIQEGEFVGWIDRDNLMNLLRSEGGGDFFNVKYFQVEDLDGESSVLKTLHDRPDGDDQHYTDANNPVDIIWMYMDIIPRNWDLGDSEYPEKWMFALAGDRVIIDAGPVGLRHGKFPVAVGTPEFDGYSVAPPSKMGIVDEMQRLIDFLYTSHIENLKRSVNNNLVVDPSLVNIHDVNDPRPGKIIRMRKKAWGKAGVDKAIQQLEVQDLTQQNIQEAQILQNYAQQATGATDQVQGRLPRRTSRISAQEIQGVRSSSLSRLERPAQNVAMQFMQPIAAHFAENVQQMMELEDYIRVTGETKQRYEEIYGLEADRGRIQANPLDLVVDYDVNEFTAAFPGKEDAQLWVELFQILGQNPELQQSFSIPRIFKHIAKQLGASNLDAFMRQQPQVVPDQEAEELRRQGDIRPVQG